MIPPASSSQHSQRSGQVHIPSTWSFWDLDSESDFESEEDGEVKEVLLPPEELIHGARRGDNDGDTLPGAKARKVMGISTDSCFEDSDDEEDRASYSSPTRSRSLRNPFKGGNKRLGRMTSGRSRRDSITESESESEHTKSSSKRRLSISGVVAPFFAQSPRMRASPSPISSTINLLRSSLASPVTTTTTTTTKRSLSSTDDEATDYGLETQWTRKLDEAAKAAKWQTAIEHRPKQRRSSSSCGSISSRLLSPSPVLDAPQFNLPSRLDDLPSPSLSPALSKRLSQIQQCKSSSTASLQQGLSSVESAPPRPAKSSRRGTQGTSIPLLPLPPKTDDTQEVEYLNSKTDDNDKAVPTRGQTSGTISPASSRSSQRVPSRSGITSPSHPRSTPRRQSNASSAASYDEQSPGLSHSSSTSNSSVTGTPQPAEKPTLAPFHSIYDPTIVHTLDHGVVSPFTKPRQAPQPPLSDGVREGLGLRLSGNAGAEKEICSIRPTLTREDSSLDPIMVPLDRSDRPTSVPLSPPSVSSEEYRSSSDSREVEDELLFALDRLDFNLQISDHHQVSSDNKNLGRISEEMADYFEVPSEAALFTSSPKTCLASDKHPSATNSKPSIISNVIPPIVPGWHEYSDASLCASPDDSALDRDAILFLQHYNRL